MNSWYHLSYSCHLLVSFSYMNKWFLKTKTKHSTIGSNKYSLDNHTNDKWSCFFSLSLSLLPSIRDQNLPLNLILVFSFNSKLILLVCSSCYRKVQRKQQQQQQLNRLLLLTRSTDLRTNKCKGNIKYNRNRFLVDILNVSYCLLACF